MENLPLLGVLVAAIGAIVVIRKWFSDSGRATRRELSGFHAQFLQIHNQYYRYSRGGRIDPEVHDDLITSAKAILKQVADLLEIECPQECFDVPTEANADLEKFREVDARCKHNLRYIEKKRLTQNQVTKDVNPLECQVWGEYWDRNEKALSEALEFLGNVRV